MRARAREERKRFADDTDFLSQLQSWLVDQYGIELVPVDKDGFLQGSRGEILMSVSQGLRSLLRPSRIWLLVKSKRKRLLVVEFQ